MSNYPNIIEQINSKLSLSGGKMTGALEIRTSGNDESLFLKNLNDSIYEAPITAQARAFRVYDSNGKITGDIRFRHETTGEVSTAIVARHTDSSGTMTSSTLKITPNSEGNVGTHKITFNGKDVLTSAGGTITGDLNINGNLIVTNLVKGARFAADNNYNDNIDFVFRHVTNGGAFLNGSHAYNDEWHMISTLKSWWHGETSGHKTYPDGFIEQWGRYYLNGMYKDTDNTISFVVSFTTTNYTLLTQANRTNNATTLINNQCFVNNRTTTNFRARCYGDGVTEYVDWYACGY